MRYKHTHLLREMQNVIPAWVGRRCHPPPMVTPLHRENEEMSHVPLLPPPRMAKLLLRIDGFAGRYPVPVLIPRCRDVCSVLMVFLRGSIDDFLCVGANFKKNKLVGNFFDNNLVPSIFFNYLCSN